MMRVDPILERGVDRAAAITRSLLGYGVVAGSFYLVVSLILALTREGFELSRHPLSLLMLGELGWLQRANIGATGLMTIAAAAGFARALRGSKAARRGGMLLGGFGAMLILSGVFPPDPMAGFPAGAAVDDPSASGLLHLVFGALAFLCLAAASFVVGGWFAGRGLSRWSVASRAAGLAILIGFVGGAALATEAAGVGLLWIAVVAGLAWLAAASVILYGTVPHPDAAR